jgi:hypothetical protein
VEPRGPGGGRELVPERRGTLVPDVVGRQRSPFFPRPPAAVIGFPDSGASAVAGSCPQEHPQVWRWNGN